MVDEPKPKRERAPEIWESARSYARHRGCNVQTVIDAIARGTISRREDGKINRAKADRDWKRNTNPAKRRNADGSAADFNGIGKHRASREESLAEMARLDLEERRGRIVEVSAVKDRWFDICRAAREAITAVPDRVAAQLAAEHDPAAVRDILSRELNSALTGLAANIRDMRADA